MTGREVGGDAWDQGFDEEGRLETISDGSDTWSFTYDGDGIRVLQESPDGISGATQRATTLFLDGGSYEVHLSAGGEETLVRRYYGVAGQRVLLDGTDTYYLLTDHLGSVVAVADSDGDLVSEQRYLPYGEGRFAPGITESDFGFTGQRNLAAVGLMDYHARWYEPSVSRFISSDTIVPSLRSPQDFNRYSYVANNPMKYVDPNGHFLCEGVDICELPSPAKKLPLGGTRIDPIYQMYDVGYDFGENKRENNDDRDYFHPGIDVHGGSSKVVSPADGWIYFYTYVNQSTGELDYYGNYAILMTPHESKPNTYYYHILAHLADDNSQGFEQGTWITAGTRIGSIGSTGNSSGPHLHWEIRIHSEEEFILRMDATEGQTGFYIDESVNNSLRNNLDKYDPRYLHQLESYWMDPWLWANTDWKSPLDPF